MGVCNVDVSLTHEKEYALAVVNIDYEIKRRLYNAAIKKFDADTLQGAITPDMVRSILPARAKNLHKGDCGRCFIIAGSIGLTGAAIMSSKSCIRCGAGLVTLGCPMSLNSIFEVALTEVI